MKQLFFILSLGLMVYSLGSCKAKKAASVETATEVIKPVFPDDWLGTYQGDLELYNAKAGKTMSLPMTIIIEKTDTAGRWRWYSKALYQGKEIIKDYNLVRHDSMPKNYFIMDENNGILLDRILLDDAFYDYFEVNGLGLYGITRKMGDDLHFEIASFRKNTATVSRYDGEDFQVDSVVSYKVVNTQKVLLKRVEADKK